MDTNLRVSIVQHDIIWENKTANLDKVGRILKDLAGKTDIAVLPEMFTTGFTMNSHILAESLDDETISRIKKWAKEYGMAICGSFIAKESGLYLNKAFFISPDGEHYYDKRHLFRMGKEDRHFSPGQNRLILEHKGFNICLLICYDLRFPVWARNIDNQYDLLIYVANWPASRARVWNTLLAARAIENVSYVCGVNRVGTDDEGLIYNGDSKIINFRGEEISTIAPHKEQTETIHLSKEALNKFREKFPVWMDADKFELK